MGSDGWGNLIYTPKGARDEGEVLGCGQGRMPPCLPTKDGCVINYTFSPWFVTPRSDSYVGEGCNWAVTVKYGHFVVNLKSIPAYF